MGKGYPRGLARGVAQSSQLRRRLFIPLVNKAVTITDPGGANAGWTVELGDFPEGNILFDGAVMNISLTKNDADLTDTFTGNVALGTAPTADATLNGSEVNLIPSTAITTAVAGVSAVKRYASTTTETGAIHDNTDGSLEVNLNGYIADAAISADAALLVNGWVCILYSVINDD